MNAWDTLKQLADLKADWDSYDGLPISPTAIRRAEHLLTHLVSEGTPLPQVFPTSRGGVQFEWKNSSWEVEIAPDGSIEVLPGGSTDGIA